MRKIVRFDSYEDSSKKYNHSVEQPLVDPDSNLAKDIMDILNGK